jgi:hypothetical protein
MYTDIIFNQAIYNLYQDKCKLDHLIEKNKDNDIGRWLVKALEWYNDKSKSQLLWELIHESIYISDADFMGSLYSFTVNYFIEAGCAKIEWKKPYYTEDFGIVFLPNGEIKKIEVLKTDPKSMPVLVLDGDNLLDAKDILEAMDIMEQREKDRIQELEDIDLDKF